MSNVGLSGCVRVRVKSGEEDNICEHRTTSSQMFNYFYHSSLSTILQISEQSLAYLKWWRLQSTTIQIIYDIFSVYHRS